jgi:hypothetical protein
MKKLVKEDVAAAFLGWSIHTLQRRRRTGSPIPFVKIGRSVRYDVDALEAYVRQQTFTSTAQYGGR